jgi:hypothetical protein
MQSMERQMTGYFLPDDWILWRSDGALEAIKLSSGDHIHIEATPELDVLKTESSASVWESLARFEPLVGQLREELRERTLQPLTRETVLRGSGWRQLFVELTGKCNEQCVHCYAESSPLRAEALSWPEISAVLRDAKTLDFGLVQLTGGDPLLSRHCVPAVELAKELSIPQIEVYTNGLALRGRTYERLRELGPSFAFSFYSHDPDTHDAITRTPGSHARTARAIRRAVEDGARAWRSGGLDPFRSYARCRPRRYFACQRRCATIARTDGRRRKRETEGLRRICRGELRGHGLSVHFQSPSAARIDSRKHTRGDSDLRRPNRVTGPKLVGCA